MSTHDLVIVDTILLVLILLSIYRPIGGGRA